VSAVGNVLAANNFSSASLASRTFDDIVSMRTVTLAMR